MYLLLYNFLDKSNSDKLNQSQRAQVNRTPLYYVAASSDEKLVSIAYLANSKRILDVIFLYNNSILVSISCIQYGDGLPSVMLLSPCDVITVNSLTVTMSLNTGNKKKGKLFE